MISKIRKWDRDTWIKLVLCSAIAIFVCLGTLSAIRQHKTWTEWFNLDAIMLFFLLGLLPSRLASLAQFVMLTLLAWFYLHDKPLTLETLAALTGFQKIFILIWPVQGWLCLFFLFSPPPAPPESRPTDVTNQARLRKAMTSYLALLCVASPMVIVFTVAHICTAQGPVTWHDVLRDDWLGLLMVAFLLAGSIGRWGFGLLAGCASTLLAFDLKDKPLVPDSLGALPAEDWLLVAVTVVCLVVLARALIRRSAPLGVAKAHIPKAN